jgi:hypothetical protein
MPAGWVSAGVAAAGAVENVMSSNSAAAAAKKNNAAAAGLQSAQNTMLDQAQTVANQPFQAYTGTMTAPLSGNQQQGISQASRVANDGTAQADNTKATGLIDQVAGNSVYDSAAAAKYMSPYTQAVTDASVAASNKNYLQNLSQIQTNAAGSGAFGGSRAAISQATAASDQNLNVGKLTATGNAAAYDAGMKNWQADNETKMNAAAAYEAAGADVTAMNSTQIADLMKTGGTAQVLAQTDLNNQYNEFMRQQDWSANKLSSLISAVGSAKGSPAQTAPIQSNKANQLMGLGSTVAGLFGGSGSSSSNAFAGTSLANNDAAYQAYNQNNAPTSGDISNLTSGAGTIDAPAIDMSSMGGD